MASTLESAIESNPHFVALVCQLSALTSAVSGPADKFETYEATGLTVSNLIVRAMLKNKLQAVSDGLGEEVLIDGDRFRRHQEGKVAYHSLCGSLEVQRYSYRRCGERNGATVIPLELTCSLVERATPECRVQRPLKFLLRRRSRPSRSRSCPTEGQQVHQDENP